MVTADEHQRQGPFANAGVCEHLPEMKFQEAKGRTQCAVPIESYARFLMMRLSHEEGKAIKNSDLHGVQIAVFIYSLTSPLQERSDAKAHAHTLLHA